ncbi:unnamed protein product [Owenia fusiformis]|uniref:Centrosomal protein of 89 kDa n=1 Tax=Owenia fusiformis TaxID=6347 RepID=A0A8S4NCJ8_OWEFU|nr:unnamed protein product [Owenia fusiformis]
MAGKKREKKKKEKSKGLPNIGAALLPTSLFTAVPRIPPPPKDDPPQVSGLATTLLNSSMLGRMFATPTQEALVSDADTSLPDYSGAEPGYSTLDNTGRTGDRGPPPLPPDEDEDSDEYYDSDYDAPPLPEPPIVREEIQKAETAPSLDAIYSQPVKRKDRRSTPSQSLGYDSSPGPERPLMQSTPNVMQSSTSNDPFAQPLYDEVSNQRDTMRESTVTPRLLELQQQNDELLQQQEEMQKQIEEHHRKQKKLQKKLEEKEQTSPKQPATDLQRLVQEEKDVTEKTLQRQEDLIRTLQDRSNMMEQQNMEIQNINDELQHEIETLRRKILRDNATSNNGEKDQYRDLRDEITTLKSATRRLNTELSRYQSHYRKLPDGMDTGGLPDKGPIPSWQVNTRYLAPLFLAYDDRILEKDNIIDKYEEELDNFGHRVEDVIKENQRLHIRLEQTEASGPLSMTEWRQFQAQCNLVMEENQLLMEQLEVQRQKEKDFQMAHHKEVGRLAATLTEKKTELQTLEDRVFTLQQKITSARSQNEAILIEAENKIFAQEHVTALTNMKRTLDAEKEKVVQELENLRSKTQSLQTENKNLSVQVSDVMAENKQLNVEVQSQRKTIRKLERKIVLLQGKLESTMYKEQDAHEYLNSVVKMAEQTVVERDTYAKMAHTQEKERQNALDRVMRGSIEVGHLEEKMKHYKSKAYDKVLNAANRLKDQDSLFDKVRREYEREIKHLKLLVQEKDDVINNLSQEKRAVENGLEQVWQASSADNRRMRDTLTHTLGSLSARQTKGFHRSLSQDKLLHLSSDSER